MNEPVRITHRDIAARLGCDKSTVSLALRGNPRISEEMRRQILALAEEMGYRPDPAIAMLARHRWARHDTNSGSTIAYLVQERKGNPRLQRRHLAPARARAQERGYQLMEFDLSAYPNGRAASKVLFNRGIRGLVLPAMPREVGHDLEGLDWDKFTAVACSLGWLRTSFHVVTPDVFEGTRLAWQEAVQRGYRRIGAALFRHAPVAVDDYSRLGASHAEQQELVPAGDRIPFLLSDPLDRDAFLTWFKRHRPDVVIAMVSRVHEWIEEAGARVPEDVAFVSLNAWPHHIFSGPSMQIDEVGRAAVDFVIAQMHDNRWGVPRSQQMLMLEPEWHEGRTLPLVTAAAVDAPRR